jgi:CBS domain-containing protein
MTNGELLVYFLTERNKIKSIVKGLLAGAISAMSLKSFPTVTVKRNAPIEEAAKIMATKKLRRLIVEDTYGKDFVDIFTASDLARYPKQKSRTGEPATSKVWEIFFLTCTAGT